MSAKGGASNLMAAVNELTVAWILTKEHWRDGKSQEFERMYLEDLPAQVGRTTTVMEELDVILRKIRSDCE